MFHKEMIARIFDQFPLKLLRMIYLRDEGGLCTVSDLIAQCKVMSIDAHQFIFAASNNLCKRHVFSGKCSLMCLSINHAFLHVDGQSLGCVRPTYQNSFSVPQLRTESRFDDSEQLRRVIARYHSSCLWTSSSKE